MKNKHFFLVLSFLLFLGLIIWPWVGKQTNLEVDLSPREYVNVSKPIKSVTYAVLPNHSRVLNYKYHVELVDYLRKKTGLRIVQVFPDTLESHLQMIKDGDIDISFVNPVVAVFASQAGAKVFAKPQGDAHSSGTDIVVRKDNEFINNLQDCIGKSWAATSPLSATGYVWALSFFAENNMPLDLFGEVSFAQGIGALEEKTLLAIESDESDFTTIPSGALKNMKGNVAGNNFKVVASAAISETWFFVAQPYLDKEQFKLISDAMLELDSSKPESEQALALLNIKKIVPASNSDLAETIKLMQQIEIFELKDLYKKLESHAEFIKRKQ